MFFSHGHEHEEEAADAEVKPAIFVDLPDVLVNLSNPGADRTQYLKVKVVLELPEQKMIDADHSRSCRASWTRSRPICASCGRPISTARPASTG